MHISQQFSVPIFSNQRGVNICNPTTCKISMEVDVWAPNNAFIFLPLTLTATFLMVKLLLGTGMNCIFLGQFSSWLTTKQTTN